MKIQMSNIPMPNTSRIVKSGFYLTTPCNNSQLFIKFNGSDSSYIQSFAFSINKSVFLEIGGFNTAFSSAGGEEFEIGSIIIQHGYKMLIDQSFYVRHHFQSFWPRFKKLLKRSYLWKNCASEEF